MKDQTGGVHREQTRKDLGGHNKETGFYLGGSPQAVLHTNPENDESGFGLRQ